jgi:hypothetical protein
MTAVMPHTRFARGLMVDHPHVDPMPESYADEVEH